MKKAILLVCVMIIAAQNSSSVEPGLYYCLPSHKAHLVQSGDGKFTELYLDTEGVVHFILIDAAKIDISDKRDGVSRPVTITSNEVNGPIYGQSGARQFYMDRSLHYFYGSIDHSNKIAYAEDGVCSGILHQ